METDKDHIHYLIEAEPTISISKIVNLWTCECGKTLNRDENAAINIMNVGLSMV